MIDAHVGWAVGYHGTALGTFDGGRSWFIQRTYVTENLHAVAFANSLHGCIVGERGRILHTINGGTNWISSQSPTTVMLNTVCYVDSEVCIAAGSYGTLLRSTDRGASWSGGKISDNLITAIGFSDPKNGIIVGSYSPIFRTSDGGFTWQQHLSEFYVGINGLAMIDSLTITIAGDRGAILRTTTGGVTWVEDAQPSPTLFHLGQNYPNPVSTSTNIPFSLTNPGHVTLSVYDMLGREIAVLLDERRDAGAHTARFDGTGLRAGMYFYRLGSGSTMATKKMLVVHP